MFRTLFNYSLVVFITSSFLGCSFTSNFTNNDMRPLLGESKLRSNTLNSVRTRSRKVDVNSEKFKIMHALQFSVTKHDGITKKEALIIAQSEVIFRGYENDYHLTKPDIESVNENTWGIEFFPVSQTLKDSFNKPNVLVTIDKRNGQIDWILIS